MGFEPGSAACCNDQRWFFKSVGYLLISRGCSKIQLGELVNMTRVMIDLALHKHEFTQLKIADDLASGRSSIWIDHYQFMLDIATLLIC